MPKPCARCGMTSSNDISESIKRLKSAKLHRDDTGVEQFDNVGLIKETYALITVMNVFTKPGGVWYNPDSPGWARRSEQVLAKIEEVFL